MRCDGNRERLRGGWRTGAAAHNCIENVLSMLAPKPRYRPATPCSLRMRIIILRAPVPFLSPSFVGAPGRCSDAAPGAAAGALLSTSVWIRVLILITTSGSARASRWSRSNARVERIPARSERSATGPARRWARRASGRRQSSRRTRQSWTRLLPRRPQTPGRTGSDSSRRATGSEGWTKGRRGSGSVDGLLDRSGVERRRAEATSWLVEGEAKRRKR